MQSKNVRTASRSSSPPREDCGCISRSATLFHNRSPSSVRRKTSGSHCATSDKACQSVESLPRAFSFPRRPKAGRER
ncbi:hypothetical protein HYQ46_012646 [Verticillium longisporum]|nr:hypothetical protein HYQ46_012646 [Verticillium longisporum]